MTAAYLLWRPERATPPAGIDLKLAIATRGKRINLPGGLPVIVDGHVIGCGRRLDRAPASRTREVANAALSALVGAKTF